MGSISEMVWRQSAKARRNRARVFRELFEIGPETTILDLGSEDGSSIARVLEGTDYRPENVHIADIRPDRLERGKDLYGFTPVPIDESKPLPFPAGFFDIVYCSSVIEHVTIPKSELWSCRDGARFRSASFERQRQFAAEIARLGKRWFVQTPAASFPIESHTWLPFAGYLPRPTLLRLLRVTNKYWMKSADPDFNLLDPSDMRALFPEGRLLRERKLGLTKSIMMIKC